MTARIKKTKIGDVLECKLNNDLKCYIQYVASDISQLNCDVIRVFKKVYNVSDPPSLTSILKDEVLFYSHCDTIAGIREGIWSLFGKSSDVGDISTVSFRTPLNPKDMDDPSSCGWVVWNVNENRVIIDNLTREQESYSLGYVFPVKFVFQKIRDEIMCK